MTEGVIEKNVSISLFLIGTRQYSETRLSRDYGRGSLNSSRADHCPMSGDFVRRISFQWRLLKVRFLRYLELSLPALVGDLIWYDDQGSDCVS